jgi:hypothetical protein
MPTSEKTDACYTGLNGATVLSEVRTISGLPSRMTFSKFSGIMNFFWILTGLREFWVIATVLRLAAWAWCKQYCLRRIRQLAETTSCIAWAR